MRKTGTLLIAMVLTIGTATFQGQNSENETVRRARSKVQPEYPELARKIRLTGTVRVEVVITPNGIVKEAKVVGGSPILASAALEAVKKWRFEQGPAESTQIEDFKFEPHQ